MYFMHRVRRTAHAKRHWPSVTPRNLCECDRAIIVTPPTCVHRRASRDYMIPSTATRNKVRTRARLGASRDAVRGRDGPTASPSAIPRPSCRVRRTNADTVHAHAAPNASQVDAPSPAFQRVRAEQRAPKRCFRAIHPPHPHVSDATLLARCAHGPTVAGRSVAASAAPRAAGLKL
eukprot:6017690-Prymnesium_polylepis.3